MRFELNRAACGVSGSLRFRLRCEWTGYSGSEYRTVCVVRRLSCVVRRAASLVCCASGCVVSVQGTAVQGTAVQSTGWCALCVVYRAWCVVQRAVIGGDPAGPRHRLLSTIPALSAVLWPQCSQAVSLPDQYRLLPSPTRPFHPVQRSTSVLNQRISGLNQRISGLHQCISGIHLHESMLILYK